MKASPPTTPLASALVTQGSDPPVLFSADAGAATASGDDVTATDAIGSRQTLADALQAVHLFAQGHARGADARLRMVEPVLYRWADEDPAVRDDPAVLHEIAVVACVRALADAELSVRVEPIVAAAGHAVARCGRALAAGAGDGRAVGALAPWAWSVVDAWLALLDPPTPAACAEVFEATTPLLDAGAPVGEPWTVDGLIGLAGRLRRIGPPAPDLPSRVIDALVIALAAPALDLAAVVDGHRRPDASVWSVEAGVPGSPADRTSWSEKLATLVTLPDTASDRRRLGAALMHLAARLMPAGDRCAPAPRAAAAARLRVAAARLWADAGRWESAIEALTLATIAPVDPGGNDHRAWCDVVHRIAIAPDAGDARRRAHRRVRSLRRWLARELPIPPEPVEEARWLGDLATWEGRTAEALSWRREAVRRVDRHTGPASLDHLFALQALRDALADHDPDHPDLEGVHDEGAALSLRLCGPLSAEHWWWRGMRALWWHEQGHPQALQDAAAEAEVLVVQTIRSGDALACACMRELVASARRVRPPAGSGSGRGPLRPGLQ